VPEEAAKSALPDLLSQWKVPSGASNPSCQSAARCIPLATCQLSSSAPDPRVSLVINKALLMFYPDIWKSLIGGIERELEEEEENSDEDELYSHTMVKTSSESVRTMRPTSTMSEGAQTMTEHNSTMLEPDLGAMVINSEDEEEDGTMKRNATSPQVPSFMDYFDKQDFKIRVMKTIIRICMNPSLCPKMFFLITGKMSLSVAHPLSIATAISTVFNVFQRWNSLLTNLL
ncbi:hypothetical protein EI555_019291, partial [Monodon monoceros]